MDNINDTDLPEIIQDGTQNNPWIESRSNEEPIKTYEIDTEKGKTKIIEVKIEYIIGFILLCFAITVIATFF